MSIITPWHKKHHNIVRPYASQLERAVISSDAFVSQENGIASTKQPAVRGESNSTVLRSSTTPTKLRLGAWRVSLACLAKVVRYKNHAEHWQGRPVRITTQLLLPLWVGLAQLCQLYMNVQTIVRLIQTHTKLLFFTAHALYLHAIIVPFKRLNWGGGAGHEILATIEPEYY